MRIETLLAPTDLSDTAARALPDAVAIARRFGARIVLVYVEEHRQPPPVPDYSPPDIGELLAEHRLHVAQHLEEIAGGLRRHVEVATLTLVGTPHIEIVEAARSHGADLIVMATHGRGFFSHALLGSTTERVLRRAPCPVLAVRVHDKDLAA